MVILLLLFYSALSISYYKYFNITNHHNETQENIEIDFSINTLELSQENKIKVKSNGTICTCFQVHYFLFELFSNLEENEKDFKKLDFWIERGELTDETIFWVSIPKLLPKRTYSVRIQYGPDIISAGCVSFDGYFYAITDKDCSDSRLMNLGWTNLSDTEHSLMENRFLMAEKKLGLKGGSETHFHSNKSIETREAKNHDDSLPMPEFILITIEMVPLHNHYHVFKIQLDEERSHIPLYKNINLCKSQTLNFDYLSQFALIFNGESQIFENETVSFLSNKTEEFGGKYLRVGEVFGEEGGKASHFHNFHIIQQHTINVSYGQTFCEFFCEKMNFGNHIHSVSSPLKVNSAENKPPYANVGLIEVNEEKTIRNKIIQDMVMFSSSLPPYGWEINTKMSKRLIRFASSLEEVGEISSEYGESSHYHKATFTTEKAKDASDFLPFSERYEFMSTSTHTHDFTVITSEIENMPPFMGVSIIQRKTIPDYIDVNDMSSEETIEDEISEVIQAIVISSVATIFFVLCVSIIIILGFIFGLLFVMKRIKKFKKLKDIDVIVEEKEAEKQERKNGRKASLRISTNLFHINYNDLKIIKKIGKGGSNSFVYLVKWEQKEVAFKCFQTNDMMKDQFVFDEFEKEVQVLASVHHPNILQFYGATLDPPRVGFIMEYCPKGDLRRFLEKLRPDYPINERIRILGEIASAMNYLHGKNIIHRDLKLENVLLTKGFESKLMDFGLSKVLDSLEEGECEKTRMVGTSYFMAPEVVIGGNYDEKCDVFSFGMVIFITITNNFQPYGDKSFNIEIKVSQDESFRPKIETKKFFDCLDLVILMKQCWGGNPQNRPSFEKIEDMIYKISKKLEDKPQKKLPRRNNYYPQKKLPRRNSHYPPKISRNRSDIPKIPPKRNRDFYHKEE